MDRRRFIKSSAVLGCGLCFGLTCHGIHKLNQVHKLSEQLKNSPFIYTKDTLPKHITLEACNICQLNCVKCWMREGEERIRKVNGFGYLKFRDFKNFVDDNNFETIDLSSSGEIFLNPELNDIIKYAFEKGIKLSAANGVNMNTLSEKTAEYLVKYQFNRILVSIDGATQEVYQIYRRGGDINKVFDNIRMINKFKKQYNSELPELVYKFIVFGHNEHEIELAKEKANELGMEMMYDWNVFPSYSPVKDRERVYRLTGLEIPPPSKYDNIPFKFEEYNVQDECGRLFNLPLIEWNGMLFGCCHGGTFNHLGVNVFEVGFLNALNSQKMLYTKKLVTDLSTPMKKDLICHDCHIYEYMKEKNIPYIYSPEQDDNSETV